MKANKLTDQRKNLTQSKRTGAFLQKTSKMKDLPKIPNSDQELIEIVQRVFPLPTVSHQLTASIMDKIKKMNPE